MKTNKPKLSKEEIEAVKASILHWQKDIEKPLLAGQEIAIGNFDCLIWKSTKAPVECYSKHCPLCILGKNKCEPCSYMKKYKKSCDDLAWYRWRKNPTLQNCKRMIKALERILE